MQGVISSDWSGTGEAVVSAISTLVDGEMIGSIAAHAAVDEPELWTGVSKIATGTATGWHHHGVTSSVRDEVPRESLPRPP